MGFLGTFDGRGYSISNFGLSNGGLFGRVQANSKIMNFALINPVTRFDYEQSGGAYKPYTRGVLATFIMGEVENVFVYSDRLATTGDQTYHGFLYSEGSAKLTNVTAVLIKEKGVPRNAIGSNALGILRKASNVVILYADANIIDKPGFSMYCVEDGISVTVSAGDSLVFDSPFVNYTLASADSGITYENGTLSIASDVASGTTFSLTATSTSTSTATKTINFVIG